MSDTVQMVCRICGKEKTQQWKQFTRWLRNNPGRPPEDYLCHDCTAGERFRTHGKSKTLLYTHWKAMFVRANGKGKEANQQYYVQRGIKVCPEWFKYEAFQKWALANGFKDNTGLVLDRINNEKDYSPKNCQWLTKSEHSIKTWEDRRNAT